jgi:hypothetical protein
MSDHQHSESEDFEMAILKNGNMQLQTKGCSCPACATAGPTRSAAPTKPVGRIDGDIPAPPDFATVVREQALAKRTPEEIRRDENFVKHVGTPAGNF